MTHSATTIAAASTALLDIACRAGRSGEPMLTMLLSGMASLLPWATHEARARMLVELDLRAAKADEVALDSTKARLLREAASVVRAAVEAAPVREQAAFAPQWLSCS